MDRKLMLGSVVVLLVGAGVGLFTTVGAGRTAVPTATTTSTGATAPSPTSTPELEGADAALAVIDSDLERRRALIAVRPSWIHEEEIANLYVDRHRLSGDFGDLREASAAIDRAFALGGAVGPFLARARVAFTLHRLAAVEPDLAVVERGLLLGHDERTAIASMRADVAFHEGRYDEALAAYEAALAEDRSPASLAAMAIYRWRTGDPEGARALLTEADAAPGLREPMAAWLALVRGLVELDGARFAEARAAFDRGLALFPGWWQLEEHLAQVSLLEGEEDRALADYEALVDRVPAPELMDAIATIHRDAGHTTEMLAWRDRARTEHEARIATFPEAAAGHAIDHFLELEDAPARAVELAEINRDARPGGEAQTKLLEAYLRADRIDDALAVAALLEATPWSTPEMHAALAILYQRNGEPERAEAHRADAERLAPGETDRMAWLRATE